MLNLFPIKALLTATAIASVAIFIGLTATHSFDGSTVHDIWLFARYTLGIPGLLLGVFWVAWRALGPVQRVIFPFIGGHWTGQLRYGVADEQRLSDATLTIRQQFDRIDLKLETRESVSRSLAVVPKRDPTGSQYHVYYVFENERKAEYCVPGKAKLYRGVAILRLDLGSPYQLSGQYFTDQPTNGVAEFTLQRASWM